MRQRLLSVRRQTLGLRSYATPMSGDNGANLNCRKSLTKRIHSSSSDGCCWAHVLPLFLSLLVFVPNSLAPSKAFLLVSVTLCRAVLHIFNDWFPLKLLDVRSLACLFLSLPHRLVILVTLQVRRGRIFPSAPPPVAFPPLPRPMKSHPLAHLQAFACLSGRPLPAGSALL